MIQNTLNFAQTFYPSIAWATESASQFLMPNTHPRLEAAEVPTCTQVFGNNSTLSVKYD